MLVRPEKPVNIGAVARTIRNTGLAGLDLVDPGDWRTVECWRTAWGAQDILERARVFPTLVEAVADVALVVGLSGRKDAGIAPVDIRDAADRVAALDEGQTAALVLGSETAGLGRDDLALCSVRARIPTHPEQPSLNLSHAAVVAACEVFRALARTPPGPRLATHAEKEALLDLWRRGLRSIDALPDEHAAGHSRDWRALFHRAPLTPKDLKMLQHVAWKMVHGDHRDPEE